MASQLTLSRPRLRVVRPEEVSPAAARARAERSLRRSLATVSVSTALLTLAGLVMVLSASSVSAFAEYGSSFLFFKRQLLYAAIGSGAMFVAARLRYQAWRRLWVPLLFLTVALLVFVLHPSVGRQVGGAARWIQLGPFSLQPSEPAKFAVVAAAASILAANASTLDREPMRWIAPLFLVVGTVSLLILLQPDLGTMTVVAGTAFVMLFLAGVRLRLLATTAVLASGAGVALVMGAGYRRARLLSFLHPWSDPRNTGYQIVQSLIALGSGHVVGVGLGAGRQKWMYVPNAHTDFIFAILGEELGLVGEVVILALFVALVACGIRIALRAPDTFGRLLAGGITASLAFQALVNLGAVTGILPITGVPLPFVSFGGSSLIVSMAEVGVLLSVGRAALAAPVRAPARRAPARRASERPWHPARGPRRGER
jgi:cell division protein FtsW